MWVQQDVSLNLSALNASLGQKISAKQLKTG